MAMSFVSKRAAQDMLLIVRRGRRRVISNEREVTERALAAQPRLQVLAFEELPITKQMEIVSTASVLIGVHGQAIAGYVSHLPADARKTAVVEIWPRLDAVSYDWAKIVPGLAIGAGVRHFTVIAEHSPGCYIDYLRQVNCTAQENPSYCSRTVQKGLKSFQANTVLNCNVTVDSERLLGVIQQAAMHTRQVPSQKP